MKRLFAETRPKKRNKISREADAKLKFQGRYPGASSLWFDR
jgi:hypothetical protein